MAHDFCPPSHSRVITGPGEPLIGAVRVVLGQIDEHVDYGELLQNALPGLERQQYGKAKFKISDAPSLEAAVMLGGKQLSGFIDETTFIELGDSRPDKIVTENLEMKYFYRICKWQ